MDSLRGEVDSFMLRANAAVLTLPMFHLLPRFRRTTKTGRSATQTKSRRSPASSRELRDDAADRAIERRCNERHPPLSLLAQQVGVPGSPTFLPKKIPRLFGCVFSALSTSDCSDA
jgi:hypothetical protein